MLSRIESKRSADIQMVRRFNYNKGNLERNRTGTVIRSQKWEENEHSLDVLHEV